MLPAGVLVHCVCKPLSLLSFTVIVFVVMACAVAYFLFSEGEEIFSNSILSAWERWKLFCKLWSVLGLVRLANVQFCAWAVHYFVFLFLSLSSKLSAVSLSFYTDG